MSEKLWQLKCCPLLAQLAPQELNQLQSRSRGLKFARHSPVYLPGDSAEGVLLLVSGRVKICSSNHDGKQAILSFIEPGELFGELALLAPDRRDEYAEAVEPSTIALIPAERMRAVVLRHPNLALSIIGLIGRRRQRIERRLKYLLFRSNRQRLVYLLLELAEQYGKSVTAGVQLNIKLGHQDLANMIGSTRETVTVLLGELQEEGQLVLGRQRIILADIKRLTKSLGNG